MWDNRAIANLLIIIANMGCYNLYFYELFWGSWEKITARALYYISTAIVSIYLIIDELYGFTTKEHYQLNLICRLTIIANFILFALILYNILPDPILYLLILNGSIFALSCMILFSGIKYGHYNREDENG